MLRVAAREAQADVYRLDDQKAQALCETVRDVLNGTINALDDYAREREVAWQELSPLPQQPVHRPRRC